MLTGKAVFLKQLNNNNNIFRINLKYFLYFEKNRSRICIKKSGWTCKRSYIFFDDAAFISLAVSLAALTSKLSRQKYVSTEWYTKNITRKQPKGKQHSRLRNNCVAICWGQTKKKNRKRLNKRSDYKKSDIVYY